MHTKRNICGSQRLITAGISAFASFGEICEDFQTYEMRHPLRLAKTGLQNFGSDHQLQDSELSGKTGSSFYTCKHRYSENGLRALAYAVRLINST